MLVVMLILYCFFNRLLLSIFGVLRVHGLTVGFFLMICSCRLIHRHIEPIHPAKIPRLRTAPNIIFANIDKTYRIFYPPPVKKLLTRDLTQRKPQFFHSLQKSSAIQKISITLLSVIMMVIIVFTPAKLLKISKITKRIGNYF